MLPHKHFAISAVSAAPVAMAFSPEEPLRMAGQWFLVSGFVSGMIDLDVYALVLVYSGREKRLRPFRNLFEIFRNFRKFKGAMAETGALAYGLITHLFFAALIAVFFYFFWRGFLIPALIGIITHFITDLPNLKLIGRAKRSSQ